MQNLTNSVNEDLEEPGESFRVTPRSIGAELTSMGFTDRKRTNRGWLIWLDRPTREHITNLLKPLVSTAVPGHLSLKTACATRAAKLRLAKKPTSHPEETGRGEERCR